MYPDDYLAFLVHFHGDRDYFECHEILESYWKSLPPEERSPVWVGLIQIAVALYHQRRGNFSGAKKMMASAIRILDEQRNQLHQLGLDDESLHLLLFAKLAEIDQHQPYTSINLPFADPELEKICQQRAQAAGISFGNPSDLTNMQLIHKHTLRDRQDVIREREQSLQERQKRRLKEDISNQ